MNSHPKPAQDPQLKARMQAAAAQQADEDPEQADEEEGVLSQRFILFQALPSWLTSFIFHTLVIIVLALIPILFKQEKQVDLIAGDSTAALSEDINVNFDDLQNDSEFDDLQSTADEAQIEPEFDDVISDVEFADVSTELVDMTAELNDLADVGAMMGDPTAMKSDTASRSGSNKKSLLEKYGGNAASEEAVKFGLEWIARHQIKTKGSPHYGSWNFNHQLAGRDRTSPNPGREENARMAATGMALMCFLGAGQTHLEGDFKQTVTDGLAYLIKNQEAANGGGSLMDTEASFNVPYYAHGLAAIALTEAWSMTRDEKLKVPAQAAVNFLVNTQDPNGGGWRYRPYQAGDTSVVGWQIMALKSANLAGLNVPESTIRGCDRFLDSVQEDSGAYYGYTRPELRRYTTTAVGLLCRMYLGWKHEHPSLIRGVEYLAETGPKIEKANGFSNMYYNYYATQVLRHYGGDEWNQWNGIMRDYLIQTQNKKGETKGSWYFKTDAHGTTAGRLYCTALAVMTLEVYYRYMPLYEEKAQSTDFKF